MVLFGEGVTGVGGEFASLVEGVVRRVEVDEIVGRFGPSQNVFKADGFDASGFEEVGARSEQFGIVDARVFVPTYGDVEMAFGVFAVESVETGFVEIQNSGGAFDVVADPKPLSGVALAESDGVVVLFAVTDVVVLKLGDDVLDFIADAAIDVDDFEVDVGEKTFFWF